MRWVTRENAKVDRVACPWLIGRFVDPEAEFLFVPAGDVPAIVEQEGAIAFDVPGAKLGHVDGRCSFESIVLEYGLAGDAALMRMAAIVHAADISADVARCPEGAGLKAIAHGFALLHGLGDPAVAAVFAGIQTAVVALVARAVHRIARHALHDGWLLAAAIAGFIAATASVPFIAALGAAGGACALVRRGRRVAGAAILLALLVAAAVALRTDDDAREAARVATPSGAAASAPRLLVSGLKAGMLTFGGAYTAIPFLQNDAVERGGWMTTETFLDGLALGGILPAPLIIFSTFVGFVAGGAIGALAMTVGIFAPAFGMTLIAHEALERLIARPGVHGFLDGVAAGVVGLIAATLADLLRAGVTTTTGALIFCAALAGAFLLKARWSVALIVLGAGVAGWLAFATLGTA